MHGPCDYTMVIGLVYKIMLQYLFGYSCGYNTSKLLINCTQSLALHLHGWWDKFYCIILQLLPIAIDLSF